MVDQQGMPIWYELVTDDPAAAERFYSGVLGWSAGDAPNAAGFDYRILSAADSGVAGLMRTPDGVGMPPSWQFYVAVSDVDAMSEKVTALGGAVRMEPMDIPEVGRFAFVTDPQGVPFYLMHGTSAQQSRSFKPASPGHCAWNELVTTDQEAGLEFYNSLFGWTKAGAMPMGPLGDYTFLHHGEIPLGAMMTQPAPGQPGRWNFYFHAADVDAARDAVEAGGGRVLHGPDEVPGGARVLLAQDPQGAVFGLVSSLAPCPS
ncbi:VOC family protein [Terrihabitans sp. B22-R8]|uniref:VOC family protein n=1 Tax=Terrihabitans sp. B22-R8 TaxID=3425128 RepID=UPI00403C5C1C